MKTCLYFLPSVDVVTMHLKTIEEPKYLHVGDKSVIFICMKHTLG